MSFPEPKLSANKEKPLLQNNPQSPLPIDKGGSDFNYKEYYSWMNEQLTLRISSLAIALLGNPTYKRPTEWRYGDKKHFVVHIGGQWQGRFHDFETGESGDALNLVQIRTGLTGKALSDWVKGFIGYVPKQPEKEQQNWRPIMPIPQEVLDQNLETTLIRNFSPKDMEETARYCYRDLEGSILGFVVRFEEKEPKIILPFLDSVKKMTLPLTYCINEKGAKSWRWKGFPVPRIPYGAEALKDSTKTVLIVEGEKTAEAAKKLFPELVVLSWLAGTGSVHLTDWSLLDCRDVILWPDNDEPGLNCMIKLKGILEGVGASSVRIVSLPSRTPHSWDLANDLPEGWNRDTLDHLIHESI